MTAVVAVHHYGMGDAIGISPAIRYLSTKYENVYVFSKDKYFHNTLGLYEGYNNVHVICMDLVNYPSEMDFIFWFTNNVVVKDSTSVTMLVSGGHRGDHQPFEFLPDNFYKDMEIDLSVYEDPRYSSLPKSCLVNTSYDDFIESNDYIFFSSGHSGGSHYDSMRHLIDSDLIFIDPSMNHYQEGHKNYEKAQRFVGLPILEYVPLIKGADEVHVADSAFCSLAKFCVRDEQRKVVYNRSGYSLSTNFFKSWEIL